MRQAGGGAIVNAGSIGSFVGQLNTPAYIASKGAVALLTKSLALDYGRDGIRVNCICPGITDTPMLREHMGQGELGEKNICERLARVPLGKILYPDDVARAVLYLVSDDSTGITGITHVIDGGLLAAAEYNIPSQRTARISHNVDHPLRAFPLQVVPRPSDISKGHRYCGGGCLLERCCTELALRMQRLSGISVARMQEPGRTDLAIG